MTTAEPGHTYRYILTRPCLQEGSLRLLKYLEEVFPPAGELTLTDDQGHQHAVTVDTARQRLLGLGTLYREHGLKVNDVLMLSRTEDGQYRVSCVVKPFSAQPLGSPLLGHQSAGNPAPGTAAAVTSPYTGGPYTGGRYGARPTAGSQPGAQPRRVVIPATPHVREVRVEHAARDLPGLSSPQAAEAQAAGPQLSRAQSAVSPSAVSPSVVVQAAARIEVVRASREPLTTAAARLHLPPETSPSPDSGLSTTTLLPTTAQPATVSSVTVPSATGQLGSAPPVASSPQLAASPALPKVAGPATTVLAASAPAAAGQGQGALPPASSPTQNDLELLGDLADLTGYRAAYPGPGLIELRAELGPQGYSVLVATSAAAASDPRNAAAWQDAPLRALLLNEGERPGQPFVGQPYLTREALVSVIAQARLAALSPIDLRGYWNTGRFDVGSADSVSELVGRQLIQRGSFSQVLVQLAQQPAHSIIEPSRLTGTGLEQGEVLAALETLCRAPFLALTKLPGERYYLRVPVRELLGSLGQYAEGVGKRLGTPAGESVRA